MKKIIETIQLLSKQDPKLCVPKGDVDTTLGHNPEYLLDRYGITNSDLIRLERLGLAIKARYEVRHPNPNKGVCGTHRVRWILFQPEVSE